MLFLNRPLHNVSPKMDGSQCYRPVFSSFFQVNVCQEVFRLNFGIRVLLLQFYPDAQSILIVLAFAASWIFVCTLLGPHAFRCVSNLEFLSLASFVAPDSGRGNEISTDVFVLFQALLYRRRSLN